MKENGRIICYFESVKKQRAHAKDTPGLPARGTHALHATLRLWGDSVERCEDDQAFTQALRSLSASSGPCVIIIDSIDNRVLEIIEECAPGHAVIAVSVEGAPRFETTPRALKLVNHHLSMSQGHIATTALISAIRKTMTRDIFGVEKYLTYGTPVRFFVLTRSDERAWLVETLMEYVASLDGVIPSGARDFARMAGEVLDEFLMNAIWDANPARSQKERSLPVFLRPAESVRVSWGVDGKTLALGVADPFGSLKKEVLYQYLDDVLGSARRREVKVNTTGPGAGIGLHMVFRRVSGVVVNTSPGETTEFVALFDLTRSPRYLSQNPKTFHFFGA